MSGRSRLAFIPSLILIAFGLSSTFSGCEKNAANGDMPSPRVPAPVQSDLPSRDITVIPDVLTAFAEYPVVGFDADAHLSKAGVAHGKDFMLRDSPWYSKLYDGITSGPVFDSLWKRIQIDSLNLATKYSSAFLITSLGQVFSDKYMYIAVLFHNDSSGALYWAHDIERPVVDVRQVTPSILRYIDTILAAAPGSDETLSADGDGTHFLTFIHPGGVRNMIFGSEMGYDRMDYDRDTMFFRNMPRERFEARKYLDSLIGAVTELGDPIVFGR